MRAKINLILLVMITTLSGCASLGVNFEDPQVKVVSLKALPSENLEQRFIIGLRILNPNATALNLVGMSYSLRLQGFDLLSGVKNDIPPIPAYSEVPVEVEASINVINGLRFFSSLLSQPEAPLNYELVAKLDVGSKLLPAVRVIESGQIDLKKSNHSL